MGEVQKKPFIKDQTIMKQLIPILATVILFVVILILPIEGGSKGGILLLILIFGGLISFAALRKAAATSQILDYLKSNGLYEQMCLETPESFGYSDYAITDTFVFFDERKICLPIKNIRYIKVKAINYINNAAKSKTDVWAYLDDGSEFCVFHWQGPMTDGRKNRIGKFFAELTARNPKITLSA